MDLDFEHDREELEVEDPSEAETLVIGAGDEHRSKDETE